MGYTLERMEFLASLSATIAAGVIASPRRLEGEDNNLKPRAIAIWSVNCATAILHETVKKFEASSEPDSESTSESETESETVEEGVQPQEPRKGEQR